MCREDTEVIANKKCAECHFNAVPNREQSECVVKECEELGNHRCACDLASLTDKALGVVKVTCDGTTASAFSRLVLHPTVSQLTLQSVDSDHLPALLQAISSSASAANSSTRREIGAIIVEQGAFVVQQEEPEAPLGSIAGTETLTGNAASSAATNRVIAPLADCGMDGVVPATDFAVPIGIGAVCPTGEFADLGNSGACSPCNRGGFYADTDGRVGYGSHCACTPCKNGTWSPQPGASDPNKECVVCPSGTQSDTPAGYRACPCLADFSRTDRVVACT